MLVALRAGGRQTAVEIGKALGLDRAPVTSALNRLRQKDLARIAGYAHHHRQWGEAGLPGVWEAVSPD